MRTLPGYRLFDFRSWILLAVILVLTACGAEKNFDEKAPEESSSGNTSTSPGETGAAKQLFLEQCASCHGDKGQGAGGGKELYQCSTCGNYDQLFSRIRLTMPLGKPGACDDDCAEKLTHYILSDFTNETGESFGSRASSSSRLSSSRQSSRNSVSSAIHSSIYSSIHSSRSSSSVDVVIPDIALLYQQQCAACHGSSGQGTAAAPALTTPVSRTTLMNAIQLMPLGSSTGPNCGVFDNCIGAFADFILATFVISNSSVSSSSLRISSSVSSARSSAVSSSRLSSSRISSASQLSSLSSLSSSRLSSSHSSLISSSRPASSSPSSSGGASADIARLYQQQCSGCHGVDGQGTGVAPSLADPMPRTDLLVAISKMPPGSTTGPNCGDLPDCIGAFANYITDEFINGGSTVTPIVLKNPLRRLSFPEYQYSIQDLFPGASLPAISLPPEQTIEGFVNQWSMSGVSELLIDSYWRNSRVLVESPTVIATFPSCRGDTCARDFIRDFGQRVYRRPLTQQEINQYFTIYQGQTSGEDFVVSTQLVVQSLLMSSQFLYRPEFGSNGQLNSYEVASRLSYLIWQSIPDTNLLGAAANGTLNTSEGLSAHVDRMLSDPKAERGVREFFGQWLDINRINGVVKNPQDNLTPEVKADLKESLLRYMWQEMYQKNLPLSDMLTSTTFYLNQRTATIFGRSDITGNTLRAVQLSSTQRAGILSHPVFLAAHGYGEYPSPVLRGVYIMDKLLCAPPSPPPPQANTNPPPAGQPLTNRQVYQQATADQGSLCASCHSLINPLGFSLEIYDTMGRFRTTDNGFPVDASGTSTFGFNFQNALELSVQMSSSSQFTQCVQNRFMTFGFGGWTLAKDPDTQTQIQQTVQASGFTMRSLLRAVALHPNFARQFYGN